jgi:hypothetical protein
MDDGEVTHLVPLALLIEERREASGCRVTESSLEEPATGMGVLGGKSVKQPTSEY